MKSKPSAKNKTLIALLVGVMIGFVWLAAIRFATYHSDTVHYHANFALYINGQRDKFDSFTFYEEVQSCGSDENENPKTLAHMHDKTNHVVHVHEPNVTWGQFFANLGYTLGDDLIKTDNGVFVNDENGSRLQFWLNGKPVNIMANEVIKSEDVLLIDYGQASDRVLQQRYKGIQKDAGEFNRRNDPSSCSGSKPLTFTERLKKALWF